MNIKSSLTRQMGSAMVVGDSRFIAEFLLICCFNMVNNFYKWHTLVTPEAEES